MFCFVQLSSNTVRPRNIGGVGGCRFRITIKLQRVCSWNHSVCFDIFDVEGSVDHFVGDDVGVLDGHDVRLLDFAPAWVSLHGDFVVALD